MNNKTDEGFFAGCVVTLVATGILTTIYGKFINDDALDIVGTVAIVLALIMGGIWWLVAHYKERR